MTPPLDILRATVCRSKLCGRWHHPLPQHRHSPQTSSRYVVLGEISHSPFTTYIIIETARSIQVFFPAAHIPCDSMGGVSCQLRYKLQFACHENLLVSELKSPMQNGLSHTTSGLINYFSGRGWSLMNIAGFSINLRTNSAGSFHLGSSIISWHK